MSEEMVSIKKDKLDELLQRIERLEYAAPKSHLAHYDDQHREATLKKVGLSVYEGKVVIGWEMKTNIVEKDPKTGVWHEFQDISLHFEDDTEEVVPYQVFVRRYTKVIGEVLSETMDGKGHKTFEVKVEDKTYKVGMEFLN